MNYGVLEKTIFKNCSLISKNKGRDLFEKGNVKSIQGKKVEDTYHIYGRLVCDGKDINTHIKYDLRRENVAGIKCTCRKHKDYLEQGHIYYCEHLAAASYKFLHSLKSKMKVKETVKKADEEKQKKETMYIHTRLYLQKTGSVNRYYIDLKIGNSIKYSISSIKAFIDGIFNKEDIKITDNFMYSHSKHKIDDKHMQYLVFIRKNIITIDSASGNKILVPQKKLHLLLSEVPDGDLLFKDMYLEYKTKINKGKLNLIFNLREENGSFILSSEKNLPISLDNENRVFLFNRELYIIPNEAAKNFSSVYNDLKRNNCIYFPGNNENYNKIISLLSSLSDKVNVNDELRLFTRKFLKGMYFLHKEKNELYCDIKVVYGNKTVNILRDGRIKLGWIRDFKYEDRLIMSFERYGFIRDNNSMKFTGEDDMLFSFLNSKDDEIISSGEIVIPKSLNQFKVYKADDVYGTIYEEDWAIKISYGIKGLGEDEMMDAFNAFKNNKMFHKTKDNNFIDLSDDYIKDMFNMISVLGLEDDLGKGMSYIHKGKASMIEEIINGSSIEKVYDKSMIMSVEEKLELLGNEKIKLSKSLVKTLRPYQYKGAEWIRNLYELGFGGILADEMGLGKTLQTIAFLSSQKNKKALIIVPTSLIYNWSDEFSKFADDIKVGIVYGDQLKREEIIRDYMSYDVLITTYGILKNDLDSYDGKEFDFCIIDEAQNIKNSESQNSKTVKSINAKFKLALTGTPLENNLKELWSIFDFIMPGFLYTLKDFEKKFNKADEKSLTLLKSLVNPFILRRTKAEAAKELPDKNEKRVMVVMDKEQKAFYEKYLADVKDKMQYDSDIQILAYLTRLRQICLHPSLVYEEYSESSGKFKEAHKIIDKAINKNRKMLVFSQFTSILDIFGKELDREGIKYFKLSGSTSSMERMRLVKDFNEKDEVNVFLISLKAGGTGLNLTSADLVIHFDPWWNPAVESQASDRAHRIGQKNDVEVIKLVAKGTIEEKIINLQDDKKDLIENILSGSSISNASINKKMIKELVSSYLDI